MGVKCTCMGTASLHAWILRIRLFRTKMNLVCQKEKIKLDCWTLKSMLNFVKMKTHKRLGSKVSCFRIPMETIMVFVYSILGQSFNSSLMSCMFQSINYANSAKQPFHVGFATLWAPIQNHNPNMRSCNPLHTMLSQDYRTCSSWSSNGFWTPRFRPTCCQKKHVDLKVLEGGAVFEGWNMWGCSFKVCVVYCTFQTTLYILASLTGIVTCDSCINLYSVCMI